jgi:predicted regulator of Ras-like GTPase activity (Roadblock/LC7/MglB family)
VPPLREVLAALAGRPDAAGALVVSDEGLVIDAVLPVELEADTIAALAATAQRTLAGLGEALGHGAPGDVVLDGPTGTTIICRLPAGASLLVLASDGADLGQLLYDLRRHAPALTELV